MLISQERMLDAARRIARGVPIRQMLDDYEELVRNSPDIDVGDMTRQELRATLSNELNSANPASPRYKEKYQPIQQLEQQLLKAEYKEDFQEQSATLMAEIDADIDMLAKWKDSCLKAAGGEFGEIEVATTPDEQLKLLYAVMKIQDQEIKLKGLNLKLKQAFGNNLNAAITETLK